MLERLEDIRPELVAICGIAISIVASAHVVLYKRDDRAAIAWVGLIWLAPFIGAILYVLLGINRIARRAQSLRPPRRSEALGAAGLAGATSAGPESANLQPLVKLVGELTNRPLLAGNSISPLVDGDEAYPAMVAAIEGAQRSVGLSTYIFDNDGAGTLFLDALVRAVERDVAVRVLIDDVGARYSFPSMVRRLRRAGLHVARFLPTLFPQRFRYSNLRSHRKILVIDGSSAFTGGMNIRAGHYRDARPRRRIEDLHFRVAGPVVAHLREVFAADWEFCTGEALKGDEWFPTLEPAGDALARGIADGPDEDFDKLRLVIHGALACARSSVVVLTPYFLPDEPLITALTTAALRGVQVDIILPQKNNLALVGWASMAHLWKVLEHGCRVWLTPPPFDHSKLLLVDGVWTLLGSANWDARSLRLNFEFNVECYDGELAARLKQLVQCKMDSARRITLADVDGRSLPVRLRDGLARLLSPYL